MPKLGYLTRNLKKIYQMLKENSHKQGEGRQVQEDGRHANYRCDTAQPSHIQDPKNIFNYPTFISRIPSDK